MSITSITIENFKGIRDRVTIDLKPITLLFGPNSAGKSTIIQALHYAWEVIGRHNLDPNFTEFGGREMDLGGFENLVHGHDLSRSISIRLDMDLKGKVLLPFDDALKPLYYAMQAIDLHQLSHTLRWDINRKEIINGWIQIQISWCKNLNKHQVTNYEVGLNNELITNVKVSPDAEKVYISYINFFHPLLVSMNDDLEEMLRDIDADKSPAHKFRNIVAEIGMDTNRWIEKNTFPPEQYNKFVNLSKLLKKFEDEAVKLTSESLEEFFSDLRDTRPDFLQYYLNGLELKMWTDIIKKESVSDENGNKVFTLNLKDGQIKMDKASILERIDTLKKKSDSIDESSMFGSKDEPKNEDVMDLNADRYNKIEKFLIKKHGKSYYYDAFAPFAPYEFLFNCMNSFNAQTINEELFIECIGAIDALPLGDGFEKIDLKFHDMNNLKKLSGFDLSINFTIKQFILGPLEILRDELKKLHYLGPIRSRIPRNYIPNRYIENRNWPDGLAAWDVLHKEDEEIVSQSDHWMTDRLNCGYHIVRKSYKEIDISKVTAKNKGLAKQYNSAPTKTRLYLMDQKSGVEVQSPDVGVGISQVIPVIVSALYFKDGIVTIEQPELHIHPALQVTLGDLFISQIQEKGPCFILETHSEHILLRLLRRIRETHEKKLPNGINGLSPDQLKIYYIESDQNGVKISDLEIDETGEFKDEWPNGFFEEREEELFY